MEIKHQVSLKNYNTFGIDVIADTLIEIDNLSDLKKIIAEYQCYKQLFFIGDGSNLLFINDFHGLIVKMQNKGIEITTDGDYRIVKASAGENWNEFVRYSLSNHCYGLENLALIPGKVGSCAVQNIGAYGREICDFIEKVYTIELQTNKEKIFSKTECEFDYRNSIFKTKLKNKYVITAVEFRLFAHYQPHIHYTDVAQRLSNVATPTSEDIYRAVAQIRKEKLPDVSVMGNAGSFFKNPIVSIQHFENLHSQYPDLKKYDLSNEFCKLSAAQLIEKCGWKGKRIGNAGVHQNQALVLVNYGNATGLEILHLAERIQIDVQDKFGIKIEMEVNVIA